MSEIEIGGIGSYYGGLLIKKEKGEYYWGIENYAETDWEKIDKELFYELLKHKK